MDSNKCCKKSRDRISEKVKLDLRQHSGFSCSICGSIPIVYHHIEEWSKKHSNDKDLLIPVCDACHRSIHGEEGEMFSKEELYKYKRVPKKRSKLTKILRLERKKSYSFFVGSNFICTGRSVSLFGLMKDFPLLKIEIISGNLMLSVLAEVKNGVPSYLIKNNELIINTDEFWDVKYSGNSLKMWRSKGSRKELFIDLIFKPDVIIVKSMNTIINDRPFKIYKEPQPQKRQLNKLKNKVMECEEIYKKSAAQIDAQPKIEGRWGDVDVDKILKQSNKDRLKCKIEHYLRYEVSKAFKWNWQYYMRVLEDVLDESKMFRNKSKHAVPSGLPAEYKKELVKAKKIEASIKEKYKKEFNQLKRVIVQHGGMYLINNMQIAL